MKRLFNLFHHHWIPSHRNNYRAKALHLDFLVALIGIVTVFSLTTGFLEQTGILGVAKDIRIERLLDLTNETRTAQGLPALRYNDSLARAAQNKGQHMLTHDYWAHFGGGKSPWDFILESGYSYEVAGENLAKGFQFSEGVVEGWKNSPTHYENIVRADYDDVGFAVMNGTLQGEETTLVVQMFGKQIAQAEPVEDDTRTQIAQVEASELPDDTEGVAGTESDSTDPSSSNTEADEASGTVTDNPEKAPAEAIARAAARPAATQPFIAGGFISANTVSFNWTMIIIGFLLSVLFLDLYFAHKMNLIRLSGKNIAHIIFLTSLFVGLLIIKNGVVL